MTSVRANRTAAPWGRCRFADEHRAVGDPSAGEPRAPRALPPVGGALGSQPTGVFGVISTGRLLWGVDQPRETTAVKSQTLNHLLIAGAAAAALAVAACEKPADKAASEAAAAAKDANAASADATNAAVAADAAPVTPSADAAASAAADAAAATKAAAQADKP
jgi:hypothetical protein